MKTKHLLFVIVILILTAFTGFAQNTNDAKPSGKNMIPFGKKLPPPDLISYPDKSLPPITPSNINPALTGSKYHPDANAKNIDKYQYQLRDRQIKQTSNSPAKAAAASHSAANSLVSNFHLTKDIHALAESNPRNFTDHQIEIYYNPLNDSASYAVLDNVIYFVADDGIHGNELWRSDGTGGGTYMVKDIEPGLTSSLLFNITAVNGKIYFSAYSSLGNGAWISDGTESGTQLLVGVSEPTEFFAVGKKVYFIANGFGHWSAIWETDGTTGGTNQLIEIGDRGMGGELITQPTLVNDLLYFTFLDYETFSWKLWRSDGTNSGTYSIGAIYPDFYNIPAQLTNYNNKLYFSASDGGGRKLWVSDGTDAGTTLAPGNHDVLISADFLGTNFRILNNVLYIPGEEASNGNGLYKYDVFNAAGLVKIKDFAPDGDTAFIVPREMQVVNNTLYFKVINYVGGIHDELWSSNGTKATTRLAYKLLPGERINNLYNGSGIFYFVKYDKYFGTELWRTFETRFGIFPVLVSDIFKGATSSYPAYLTAFKGRLIFAAADELKGNELFMTNGLHFGLGATLVKDINTVSTPSSNAGFNFYNYLGYKGMAALGKEVLFNAYERVHGYELYKSDGTSAGTQLLNDVVPGEAGFNIQLFLSKNNTAFFVAVSNSGYSIYKTNGTKNGLRKVTPDYNFIQSFSVADNGVLFYVTFNSNTFTYELWRTDGSPAGNVLLSSALYNSNYLNIIGNTALFVAGDAEHGFELWKSDGTVAGTGIVKDIHPGIGNSAPGGMFIYKNEVYFAANDGTSADPSFWKSNGKEAGTIKLKDIDAWWGNTVASTARYFCIFNNLLYFSAIDYSTGEGTVLWKTDGTPAGTQVVKDINPTNGDPIPGPYYLTDVNGTLYFMANDGVNGNELWKSDGSASGTQLVKDITPGIGSSNMSGFTSFAGKLYFQNAENSRYYLWSSDGTAEGTEHVADPGITDVGAAAIFSTGDKLFVSGYTSTFGTELYAGKAADQTGKFVMSRLAKEKLVKTTDAFDAVLYPNPVQSNATLQFTGGTKNISVSITGINGGKLWQSNSSNAKFVQLPTEQFAPGTYLITMTNGSQTKTIQLVKQ